MKPNNVLNDRELHNRGIDSKESKKIKILCTNRCFYNLSEVTLSVPLSFLLSVRAYLAERLVNEDEGNSTFLTSLYVELDSNISRFINAD